MKRVLLIVRRTLLVAVALLVAAIVLPPLWYAGRSEPVSDLPPAGRRVQVSPGLSVNLIEAGSGPPVLLVHGHPGCAYDWAPTMTALVARGHRVFAYDRIGYGYSDGRSPGSILVETNATELLRLMGQLALPDLTLVGTSYGGATAIVAAKRDASHIARLVLVGSVGPGIEERGTIPEPLVDFLVGPVLSWVWSVPPANRRFGEGFAGAAFHPDPVPDWYMTQTTANFARPHTKQTFRSEGRDLGGVADLDPSPIELPVLVVQGQDDLLVPPVVGENLHALAPNSELRRVPGAGHMLQITHATLLADAISAFAGGSHGPLTGGSHGAPLARAW